MLGWYTCHASGCFGCPQKVGRSRVPWTPFELQNELSEYWAAPRVAAVKELQLVHSGKCQRFWRDFLRPFPWKLKDKICEKITEFSLHFRQSLATIARTLLWEITGITEYLSVKRGVKWKLHFSQTFHPEFRCEITKEQCNGTCTFFSWLRVEKRLGLFMMARSVYEHAQRTRENEWKERESNRKITRQEFACGMRCAIISKIIEREEKLWCAILKSQWYVSECFVLFSSVFSCVSLSVSVCLPACLPACLSVCLPACLSLSVSVCLCLSLSVSVCLCLSLSVSVCLCLSLSVSVCLCLSLSVSVCFCLSLNSPHEPQELFAHCGSIRASNAG